MNRLQAVNEVLTKLREPPVASSAENSYSSMIVQFIQESYNEIVKAAEWTWLRGPSYTTGLSINSAIVSYGTLDQPMGNILTVYDRDTKYFIPKAKDTKYTATRWREDTSLSLTGTPLVWFQEYDSTGALRLRVWPRPKDTVSYLVTLENLQDIGSPLGWSDLTAIQCPGYLLVLGAFEKALLERDGDTPQYQRALSAYTMAISSQASMDNAMDSLSTDWVPE